MSQRPDSELVVVGWREWVNLPGLGVKWIKAKVDSGACSSSLHALDLELFEKNGVEYVRFKIFPHQFDDKKVVVAEARVIEHRKIRSSNGQITDRPVIETNARVAGKTVRLELTLANRVDMGFRMLLGRKALRGNFLVDCSVSYRGIRPRKKSSATRQPSPASGDEGALPPDAARAFLLPPRPLPAEGPGQPGTSD
jgi:hypothetical protein